MTRSKSHGLPLFLAVSFLILALDLVWAPRAAAQTPGLAQTPSLSVQTGSQTMSYEINGHIGAILRYGGGDGRRLSLKGYSTGLYVNLPIQIDLLVSALIEKPFPRGTFSLMAQLDNNQPDALQAVKMLWEADTWKAEYGDFPMGREGSSFAYASRLLKGFKVDWSLSDKTTLSAILSQVSGNFETKTFRGSTVETAITFSYHPADEPFATQPYGTNLDGLEYFSLGESFVEGFTEVQLGFLVDSQLQDVLRQYDLEYLYNEMAEHPESELDQAQYYSIIPAQQEYFLALNVPYLAILRERIFDLIDQYDTAEGLEGEHKREYPFNQDTQFELDFLELLAQQTQLRVDGQIFGPSESSHRRFYSLHVRDVQQDSVKIEVAANGDYLDIHDPSLVNYDTKIYPEIGVVELRFPQEFFENRESAVKVTFSYESGTGFYVLGLTVLRDSEKVYLNNTLLQRNVDYLIQYEEGVLVLFNPLGEDDALRIEYETARGGLLGFTDFGRSFNSLSFHTEPSEKLQLDIDLLQAHDSLKQGVEPETLETMPNTHTVLGVSGKFQHELADGSFDLGVTQNRFPPDNNQRANQSNSIHVIRVIEHDGWQLVLFGHRNGLLVFDGVAWSSYGIREGLTGQEVFDIAYENNQLVFATSGGITLLKLDSGNPMPSFARKRNWSSYDERDGVPGAKVSAVALRDGVLWAGSELALGQVELAKIAEVLAWKYYQKDDFPELPSDKILTLIETGGWLYIGTDRGLAILDTDLGYLNGVPELAGYAINDLTSDGRLVYAATPQGIRALEAGIGVGWPVSGKPVHAVGVLNGELWYGTDEGLAGVESGKVKITQNRPITALAGTADSIWAGETAGENYQLFLYKVQTPSEVRLYQEVETRLSGRADHRFQDILPEGHTDRGLLGRLLLTKNLAGLHLEGFVEAVTPGFSPVGSFSRRDHLLLNLSGTYPISAELSLQAAHQEGLFDRARLPSLNISDQIGVAFTPEGGGPQIHIDSALKQIDRDFAEEGFDQKSQTISVTLQQSFWGNKLAVNLGYSLDDLDDFRRPVYSYWSHNFSSDLRFEFLPGLQLRSGYRFPISQRFGELASQHQLDWQLTWNKPIPIESTTLVLAADYRGSARIPGAGGGDSTLTQNGQLSFSSSSMQVGGLRMTPRLSLTGSLTDPFGFGSNVQLAGDGNIDLGLGALEAQIRYRKSYVAQRRSDLTRLQDSLTVNINYAGFSEIKPTLAFTGSLDTLIHPFFGRKLNGQYGISLQLVWQSAGPLSADLLFSRDFAASDREERTSYSLQQTLRYEFFSGFVPSLTMQFDYLQGKQYGEPVNKLDGELSLAGEFEFRPGWSSSFNSIYLFTLDGINAQESRSSFLIEFQVGVDIASLISTK